MVQRKGKHFIASLHVINILAKYQCHSDGQAA